MSTNNQYSEYEVEDECKHWENWEPRILKDFGVELSAQEQLSHFTAKMHIVCAEAPIIKGYIAALPHGLKLVEEILYKLERNIESYGKRTYPLSEAQVMLLNDILSQQLHTFLRAGK